MYGFLAILLTQRDATAVCCTVSNFARKQYVGRMCCLDLYLFMSIDTSLYYKRLKGVSVGVGVGVGVGVVVVVGVYRKYIR